MAARGNEVEIVVRTKDQATGPSRTIVRHVTDAGDKAGRGFSKRLHGGLSAGFGPIRGMVRGFGTSLVPLLAGVGVVAGAKAMRELGFRIQDLDKKARMVFAGQLPLVRRWADANKRAFGLSRRETVGLAASFADLLIPMGFTRSEAAKMSTDVVGLAGALSKWTGGTKSVDEVSRSLSKAMLGEREELKELGISITEAEVQGRLLEKGQQDLTGTALQQAEAIATQELILEKSKDAQAAWAKGGKEASEAQKGLSSTIAEVKEQLAAGLEPALKRIVKWLGETLVGALANAKKWWGENKDAVRLLGEVLKGFFTPAAKGAAGELDGVASSAITLKQMLSGLLVGVLRLVQGWLIAEMGVNHLMSGFASLITAGGHAINVVDRLSGGTGHAGDAMIRFGQDLKRTARVELQAIQRDARNAQAAIDRMHGKHLSFTASWSGVAPPRVGSTGGSPFGVAQHGGIVRRPTMALLGEAGPEAVVPLHRTPGNGPLPGGGLGGGGPLVLNIHIGGQAFGRVLVDPLRKEIRSLGGDVQVALGAG